MFKKILIANRGEIACRIIRTARRMRIRTVAVFSEADRDALHVRLADEAHCIGPPPATASYLDMDRIIEVCRTTGAEAVHPGYGFLSENTAFSHRLAEAGIVFIGPPPEAIAALGDKLTSKQLAAEAGVPTIPGHDGIVEDADQAVAIARQLGYPVMLKASAGGGGKGMRVVRDDEECREGFARAQSEAESAFGDGRLLAEKFIEEPRHIEMQIIADNHGNVFYLGERECSIQRRHQKVIEESPSPFIDPATRRRMGEQAVALARRVGYRSAGTVEFIVDRKRNVYFLEMNTRLQVEHPVTEFVTGLDLVELMIRVAAGQDLRLDQERIIADGWAVEARIYAEDPERDFLPSSGRLVYFRPPAAEEGVRVDTGCHEGGEVPVFYDPMIAKLVTHGATRMEAINRMRAALDMFYVRGVTTNIDFLQAVFAHPRFQEGRLSTHFIAEEFPDGFKPGDAVKPEPEVFVVAAAAIHHRYTNRAAAISGQIPGHGKEVRPDWVVLMDDDKHPVSVRPVHHGVEVSFGGRTYMVTSKWRLGEPIFRAEINRSPICMQVERTGIGYRIRHGGSRADVLVLSPRAAELNDYMVSKKETSRSPFLVAPMPGLLISVLVHEGDEVAPGDPLVVVEAMKMENTLRADRAALIKKILVQSGDSLAADQPILEFAPLNTTGSG